VIKEIPEFLYSFTDNKNSRVKVWKLIADEYTLTDTFTYENQYRQRYYTDLTPRFLRGDGMFIDHDELIDTRILQLQLQIDKLQKQKKNA
jgi:hypothetical protein